MVRPRKLSCTQFSPGFMVEVWCIVCALVPQPADCEALCAARAQYVDHPADFCFRLPDGLSHEQGAFAEPLSVGAQAGCIAGDAHPFL